MMIKSELYALIAQAAQTAFPDLGEIRFDLTHPELEQHGDYAANLGLVLAKHVGLPPRDVAEKVIAALGDNDLIQKVEVAGPGFINIYLNPQFLWSQVLEVISQGQSYGIRKEGGRKIMFEYGTPNTHKMPHIGHLFSYCYGESMTRILEANGNSLFRENYQGDVGLHVAKCLWAYQKNTVDTSSMALAEKIELLQTRYQEGSLAYDEDPQAKQEIDQLNKKIYDRDVSVVSDWEETRSWCVDYYAQFEERIGSHFQNHYFESQTNARGKEIVLENVGKVFEEDQGAVIFRGEKHGLHTRVFINQLGNPTYEAKDVGLMSLKLEEDFKADEYVITTAMEQNEYMKVVFKAHEELFPDTKGKLRHIGFGLVNLTTGKMSSRTGQILTAFSLLELVKERVRQHLRDNRDYTPEEAEEIAEIVALGAVKYSFLRSTATKNISFDLESSISFEGNSGPYLQYTYARCQSVLRKAGEINVSDVQLLQELSAEESSLLRWVYRYSEAIDEAATQYSPHAIAGYLFELAQRYSVFYNNQPILVDDLMVRNSRLILTKAVAQVLGNGLNLLGIKVADKI